MHMCIILQILYMDQVDVRQMPGGSGGDRESKPGRAVGPEGSAQDRLADRGGEEATGGAAHFATADSADACAGWARGAWRLG